MKIISKLKRGSYIGSAAVLTLTAMPVVPVAEAWADGESCEGPTTSTALRIALDAGENVKLCGDIFGGVNVGHAVSGVVSATLDLNGHKINAGSNGQALIVSSNASVNIIDSIGGGGLYDSGRALITVNGSLTINGGEYRGLINAVGGSVTVNDGTFTASDSIFGLGHPAENNSTDTITINDGAFTGNYIANKAYAGGGVNSSLTINNGDFRGVTSGITKSNSLQSITTINGGVFGADPTGYEADGLDVYSFAETANYWRVGSTSELTAKETIVAAVGNKIELFRATPVELSQFNYDVLNSSGADVSSDVVIEVEEENDEYVGYITALKQGRKEIDVRNNSGDTVHVKFLAYEIQGVNDQVMQVGTTKEMTDIKSNKWGINWTLSSDGDAIEIVDGKSIKAIKSGEALVTVTFDDDAKSQAEFTVYVYDFNVDEDVAPILIKKGETATIRTDSNWGVTDNTTGNAIIAATAESGVYTITGANAGKTTLTFSTNVGGNYEEMSKSVDIYVYDVTEDELFIDGNAVDVTTYSGVELGDTDSIVVRATSDDDSIASVDGYSIKGESAGNTTIMYTLTVEGTNNVAEIPVTVHVYTIETAESITMVEGAEAALNDSRVAEIGNAEVVTASVTSGEDYASVDDEAADTGKIKASAKGTATVKYYVNGNEVASVEVKVYALQNPETVVVTANRLFLMPRSVNVGSSVSVELADENLPNYTLSENSPLINVNGKVVSSDFWSGNAGEATVTVRYEDTFGGTSETFKVIVSKYSEGMFDSFDYDVAQGDTISFKIGEEYDQTSVNYLDDLGFEINRLNDGYWSVKVPDDMAGDEYELSFADVINNVEIASRKVTIRVHEIETSANELYIKKDGEAATITVKEKNTFGNICRNVFLFGEYCDVRVTDANGATSDGVEVTSVGDDQFEIKVNEAGEYKVTFGDGTARRTVTVYAIDFTVEESEYHIVKGDTNVLDKMITALNKYWEETQAGDSVTGFEILKSSNSKYYALWSGAEADKYEVEFYAYAGPDRFNAATREVRDTKTVTIYVYDMVKPEQTEYYGEMKDGKNEFEVVVADRLNEKVADMAKIDYTVTEGDASGITVDIENGKVIVNKPGKYTVKYTDTMNHGEGGLAGEYTATFEVFNLDAEAEKGQILDLGDAYEYTINSANTYGDVEVVISRTDENGDTTEISRTTTAYPNDSAEDFEFTPEEEGKYTVRIENLSAKEHGFREVEKGEFYVVARAYDFKLVRAGEVLTITSDSIWSVDSARDNSNPESLIVEDGVVTYDTTGMELGVRTVTLFHKFSKGQKEPLKRVTIAIYDMAPESTPNNNVVIDETLEDLFDKVEELTNDPEALAELEQKVWEAIMESMASGEEVDFETVMGVVNDILGENATFNKAQEIFGSEWQTTLENLNEAVAYGDVIRTRVNVEEITPETDVKNAILKVLNPYGVDNVDYYDVTVEMYVTYEGEEGEEEYSLGLVHKLNGKLTVALAKTTDPETGYARTYYVVRMHDGEEPEVLVEGVDFYIEDGVIYVISDKFSTYAVAYKDTLKPTAPDTGAAASAEASVTASMLIPVMTMLVVLGLAGAVKFAKRK